MSGLQKGSLPAEARVYGFIYAVACAECDGKGRALLRLEFISGGQWVTCKACGGSGTSETCVGAEALRRAIVAGKTSLARELGHVGVAKSAGSDPGGVLEDLGLLQRGCAALYITHPALAPLVELVGELACGEPPFPSGMSGAPAELEAAS